MSADPVRPVVPAHDPSSANEALDSRQSLGLFSRNVAVLIAAGVLISWWWLEYTDFFPKVGGFFGLAGVFAWIAFLSNMVKAERKTQLQDELESRILTHPHTATYALLVLLAFGIWAALHGTLVIIAPGGGSNRAVEIRDGDTIETVSVAPGSTVKRSLWTPRGTRDVVVKTSGLPDLGVTIRSLGRTSVVVPQSFMAQPVVFARGLSGEEKASLGNRPSVVAQIRRGKGPWRPYDTITAGGYGGESLWIGASADTELPADVRERWRRQNAEDADVQPKALGAGKPLRAGDAVRLCVLNSEGGEAAYGEVTVLAGKQRPFPQELQMKFITDDEKRCAP